jgi:uncharacterized membrane protein HdeD (DUF308 family)
MPLQGSQFNAGNEVQRSIFGMLEDRWGGLLALGIILVILGFIGLGMTFTLTVASVIFFGILICIGGVFQFAHCARARWNGNGWQILIALVYIAVGVVMIIDPVLASTWLTLVIGIGIAATGVSRLAMAYQVREHRGAGWLVIGGLAALVLAAFILFGWPTSGLWVIGMFVAIELILNGWSAIFVALAARRARGAN